jgi:hypothetical protein
MRKQEELKTDEDREKYENDMFFIDRVGPSGRRLCLRQ